MSFKASIAALFHKIVNYFVSGKAQEDFEQVSILAVQVAPFIDMAAKMAAGFLPQPMGALTLAAIKGIEAKYPRLFDGSLNTEEERKVFLLGVATELVKKQFPTVNTSVARAALQLAYIGEEKGAEVVA